MSTTHLSEFIHQLHGNYILADAEGAIVASTGKFSQAIHPGAARIEELGEEFAGRFYRETKGFPQMKKTWEVAHPPAKIKYSPLDSLMLLQIKEPKPFSKNFYRMILHDMGNLTHILPAMLEEFDGDPVKLGNVKRVIDNLLHIQATVSDVELIRGDGELKVNSNRFHIEKELQSQVSVFEEICRLKGLKFSCKIELEGVSQVFLDRAKFERILGNLFFNALKFTKEGEISLVAEGKRVSERQVGLKLSVQDTGPGIAQDQLDKIFAWRFQSDPKSKGSGLGLYISRSFAEAMGGTLTASNRQGGGAMFTLDLTLNNALGSPNTSRKQNFSEEDFKGIRLLHVEDNAVLQKLYGKMFSRIGFAVTSVANAEKGLEKLQAEPFDVVLTDINMPGSSGFDFTKAWRVREKDQGVDSPIPIIGLSATVGPAERSQSLAAGMESIILKGSPQQTLKHIKECVSLFVLEQRRLRETQD